MPRGRMQRIPFNKGWAYTQEPGLPVADDDDDEIVFEESPASPDPSSADTLCYEITASGVVSESSSIPMRGLHRRLHRRAHPSLENAATRRQNVDWRRPQRLIIRDSPPPALRLTPVSVRRRQPP